MIRRLAIAAALIAFIVPAAAQQRDRASIADKYKWDLTHIYPSNAAWRAAKSAKLRTQTKRSGSSFARQDPPPDRRKRHPLDTRRRSLP